MHPQPEMTDGMSALASKCQCSFSHRPHLVGPSWSYNYHVTCQCTFPRHRALVNASCHYFPSCFPNPHDSTDPDLLPAGSFSDHNSQPRSQMGQAQGGHSRCCKKLLLHIPCPAYKAAQNAQGARHRGSSGLRGNHHALDALRHTAADLPHRRQQAATDALRAVVLLHEYGDQSTYFTSSAQAAAASHSHIAGETEDRLKLQLYLSSTCPVLLC